MAPRALLLLLLTACLCVGPALAEDFYSFTVKDHQGQEVALERYRGKVTLVVNVASLCGYTESTYRDLKKLHDILSYGDWFSVLAFPCNQFGEQEPYDIEDIVEHVTSQYGVEFPILNKINVYGEDAEPAFKFLTDSSSVIPDWNFYKYLIDGSGQVVKAWGTRATIQEIFDDVQAAVNKAKVAGKSSSSEQQQQEEKKEGKKQENDQSNSKDEL